MSKVSKENQNLAQFVGVVFGSDWQMAGHVDDQQKVETYTLSGRDVNHPGIVSYATIGLSDYRLGQDKSKIALGAEIVGACYERFDYLENALAAAASFITAQKLVFKPGTIFANILTDYDVDSELNHILFTVPSLWPDKLYPLNFQSKTVLWLQAVPISDVEKAYAEKHGPGELGDELVKANADLYDLRRGSVV